MGHLAHQVKRFLGARVDQVEHWQTINKRRGRRGFRKGRRGKPLRSSAISSASFAFTIQNFMTFKLAAAEPSIDRMTAIPYSLTRI